MENLPESERAWLFAAVGRRVMIARLVLAVPAQRPPALRPRTRRAPAASNPPCPGAVRRY
jgi:hypothetical protein